MEITIGLYYNGARYLAAWLGRWTSADPIGIGADGPGLYNYTRGSPVNYTDPSGTQSFPEGMCKESDPPEFAAARTRAYDAAVKHEEEVAAREEAAGPRTFADRLIHLDFRGAVSSHIDNSIMRGIVQGAEGAVEGQADFTREALATQGGLIAGLGRLWKDADVARSADPEARAKQLDNVWRMIPNPIAAVEGLVHEGVQATRSTAQGDEAKGRLIFTVLQTVASAVIGGAVLKGKGPRGTVVSETATTAESALPATARRTGTPRERFVPPLEKADLDHDILRDETRRSMSGFESGRHDMYPGTMRDRLRAVADEAERNGQLPEYVERMREIAETYAKRAQAGHRGGR